MSGPVDEHDGSARFIADGEFRPDAEGVDRPSQIELVHSPKGSLPGASLASWALMARRLREEVIGRDLFCDPAWDILLDLYVALDREDRVQVTSVSSMAGVPPSTGRRWVRRLIERGFLEREKDPRDHRLTYLKLTQKGQEVMAAFMARLAAKGTPASFA